MLKKQKESSEKTPIYKRKWVIGAAAVVVLALAVGGSGSGSDDSASEPETTTDIAVQETASPEPENTDPVPADASELDVSGFTEGDKINFSIVMDIYGGRYFNGWKTSIYTWDRGKWEVIKWDNEGAVGVKTTASVEGVATKQTAIMVLTPEFYGMDKDFDKYTVHYFQVGDVICCDDGYADETLQILYSLAGGE